MPMIEPSDSELESEFAQRFWEVLQATMQTIFPSHINAVWRYKEQLDSATPTERLLALHDDPIDVAATLAGSAITPEMLALYDKVVGRLDNFSRRFELHSGILQTTAPVTLAQLDSLLGNFSYEPVPHRDQTAFRTWQKTQNVTWDALGDFPRFITLLAPDFSTQGMSEAVYDRDYIIDLILHLIVRKDDERLEDFRNYLINGLARAGSTRGS
jgi:hypothetical protein